MVLAMQRGMLARLQCVSCVSHGVVHVYCRPPTFRCAARCADAGVQLVSHSGRMQRLTNDRGHKGTLLYRIQHPGHRLSGLSQGLWEQLTRQ